MKISVIAVLLAIALGLMPTNRAECGQDTPLVHEATVNAPVEDVWAAFTTKAGLESWMAAHAEIDLKVGGKMRTRYDQTGELGDAKAIENTILSFEPKRMLSFQVSRPPEGFAFPNAVKTMWTVIYFEALEPQRTRVCARLVHQRD